MTKYFISLLLFILLSNGFSQPVSSGKIIFQETIQFKIDFGDDNPELAKMIPTSQTIDKALFFTPEISLFKNNEQPDDLEINQEAEGNQVQLVIKMPESVIYTNRTEDLFLQSQDIMGKEFLIKDKIIQYNWKLTGEQKKILDFVCQKAILLDTSKQVVAWFTPQIPVSFGPAGMNGLPGMILALEQDNGDRMTIATSIESIPENFIFEKPTKGKKVTLSEFERIREEKLKEMGAVNGGGHGIKMIIREER